jgi:hypothetical protein
MVAGKSMMLSELNGSNRVYVQQLVGVVVDVGSVFLKVDCVPAFLREQLLM